MKPLVIIPVLGCMVAVWGAPRQPLQDYGKLPLAFERNQGQAGPDVQYLARGAGYTLSLTGREAVLNVGQAAVRMQLMGANPHAPVAGSKLLPGKTNYFIGNQPSRWRTNIPNFGEVRYEGIYPGIDLVYYGQQGQLEYDFVVAPVADPQNIRLEFGGADFRVDQATGDLLLLTGKEQVRFHKPVAYQDARHRHLIDVRYKVHKHRIGFAVGKYDHTRPLVIDPALVYSTYFAAAVQSNAIAVDSAGNAYIAGFADGLSGPFALPTTPGVFQPEPPGGYYDAFITKLNANGTALVYCTYLGGSIPVGSSVADQANGIAVDTSGNAYVTGQTTSKDFPVTSGAYQLQLKGSTANAFATKLNPSGSALVYSTYLGGSLNDWGQAVTVDASGDAYVTGSANSADFPVTAGAFQPTSGGATDVFVTELSPDGTRLIYSTYLGGSGNDAGQAITLGPSGTPFITGPTQSSNFPVTAGTAQNPQCFGGPEGFVTQLNATGSALVYSGCFGATPYAIAVDSSGAAYLTGTVTYSINTTPGAYQTSCTGDSGFVMKFNPSGTALDYSTCLGTQYTTDYGIAVDSSGNAYVTGQINIIGGLTYPSTTGAFQSCSGNAPGSAILTELNAAGSALIYSTCLITGLSHAIAMDAASGVYITGYNAGISFPISAGAYQSTCLGSCGFVSKFVPGDQVLPVALNFGNLAVGTAGGAQTVTLTNTGANPLTVNSVQITGANSADFSQTNTCTAPMAPGATCTISVQFTPSLAGVEMASVIISDFSSTMRPVNSVAWPGVHSGRRRQPLRHYPIRWHIEPGSCLQAGPVRPRERAV